MRLDVDKKLVREAMELGGHKTTKEAVNEALMEYVRSRRQRQILSLFGQIEYDPQYDHKAERRAR